MKRLVLPILSVFVFIGYFAWRDWRVPIDTENDNHCAAVTSAFIVVGMGELGIKELAGVPAMASFLKERAQENARSEAELEEEFDRLRQAVLDDPRLYNNDLVACIDRTLPDPEFRNYIREGVAGAKERFEGTRQRIERMRQQMGQAVEQ